jgi:DNA-binding MarR family transcriptional regulator
MYDIFLSYSSKDRFKAQNLFQLLSKGGFSVFYDRSTIPTGEAWHDFIDRQLADARAVVVLWSRHSVGSAWALYEAGVGLSKNALFPVLIDPGVKLPTAFQHLQTPDLSYSDFLKKDIEIDNLVRALGERLGRAAKSSAEADADSQPEFPDMRHEITLVPEHWLSFPDLQILLFFVHQSQITCGIVADILMLSEEEAQRHLNVLMRGGFIERQKSGQELIREALADLLGSDGESPSTPDSDLPALYGLTDKGRKYLQDSVMNP